jgi:2-dehydropantoate 2-reductase
MLQDVRNRRPTEIDSINGAIVKAAKELDIPVPVNEELVRKVKEIEKNYFIE